jgi:multiple sugar transport system substrate-binding protein
VDWNWEAVTQIARLLTLDKNGKNATQEGFDRTQIRQYGFAPQWMDAVRFANIYADSAKIYTGDRKGNYQAVILDSWKTAWAWWYAGMWGQQPFIPNTPVSLSALGDDPFGSGKVAMALVGSFYLRTAEGAGNSWDLAVLPLGADGKVHGRADADTFYIWKGTQHSAEAFTVLTYLLNPADPIGLTLDPGAVPARASLQGKFIQRLTEIYPFVKNWNVLQANLNYVDLPSAEGYLPNQTEAWDRMDAFTVLLGSNGSLNLTAEVNQLGNDLTEIFNK